MARRAKYIRLTSIKTFLWLFLCALLLSKTKQAFQRMTFEVSDLTPIQQDNMPLQVTVSDGKPQCSENQTLGLPKYVADRCPPEDHLPCSNLTCANILFSGNASIYNLARAFMKLHAFPRLQDADFVGLTRDCSSFRLERGYEQKMKNDYEDFPIAFNLIVHEDVEQIERLIYALYRPKNRFCIHLDLKSPTVVQEAMEGITRCLPNVFMASGRVNIYWGDYNRLLADIICMRDHVQSNADWRYLINSAGQAFPIRSMHEMVEILKIYKGANDVEGMTGYKVIRGRFEFEYVMGNNSMIERRKPNVRRPKPPHEIEIVRGSAYGVFSRGFVEYVLTDERARDLLSWAKGTFSPDEFYWATLHHAFANPHLRAPGGYPGGSWMCARMHVLCIDMCNLCIYECILYSSLYR